MVEIDVRRMPARVNGSGATLGLPLDGVCTRLGPCGARLGIAAAVCLSFGAFGSFGIARTAHGATLEVGPGKTFDRIEKALEEAKSGDTILVHPAATGLAWSQTSCLVRTAKLSIRAARTAGSPRVKIDGTGFEYSGSGRVPRAIFQFDPGADGCLLEGFDLSGAHNESTNGAGVRINQANDVTIRDCEIHENDMGIMSNGGAREGLGKNQLIEACEIHHNGTDRNPGYNHNLYLGGTSVTLRACNVHHSTTGHNVKSRAHVNRIEYCRIHESANREFDLVDAANGTDLPESHSILLGNLIVKAPEMDGNKTVIHFGQDGGKDHVGTLWLVHNTIVTPFISPVVEVSAPGAAVAAYDNIVWSPAPMHGKFLVVRGGAEAGRTVGLGNWIGPSFELPPSLDAASNRGDGGAGNVLFADPAKGDYRPRAAIASPRRVAFRDFAAPGPALLGVPTKEKPLLEPVAALEAKPRRDAASPSLGAFAPK